LFLLYNVTQVGTTLCRFLYKKTSLLFKTIKQFTVINSSFSCYDEESKEQVDEEVYKKEEGKSQYINSLIDLFIILAMLKTTASAILCYTFLLYIFLKVDGHFWIFTNKES